LTDDISLRLDILSDILDPVRMVRVEKADVSWLDLRREQSRADASCVYSIPIIELASG
jgi:hypothetical protein